jgi:amino acid transporter
MARDGMLPKIFAKTSARTQAPWVAILACAMCWALCVGLGFKRLVTLDIMLYGAALMLEFVTLVALRIREPQLKREFRVPGGLVGAILAGVFPLALLMIALVQSETQLVLGINGLLFGVLIMAAGFALYASTRKFRKRLPAELSAEVAETA